LAAPQFELPPHQVYTHQFGHGQRALVAFHGFGLSGQAFAGLAAAFPGHTLYCPDLFFHGQSHWEGSLHGLGLAQWQRLFTTWLAQQGLADFDLLGYSLGGRLALVTYALLPAQVGCLWLVAPDGIKPNAWYRLATRYPLLHGLFGYVTAPQTNLFHRAVGLARPWLAPGLRRLAEQQMSQPALRARVYRTWMLYRHLEPDLRQVARLARQHGTPVRVFTGTQDWLVRAPHLAGWLKNLPTAQATELQSGHHRLLEALAAYLLAHPGELA
jgi:pimeloyl-ACP methyl ester carboxylesterase